MLLACSDSVIGPGEAIVGSWRTTQGGQTVTWTFQNTGALRVVTEVDEVGTATFSTRFTLSGETITLQAFSGNDDLGNTVVFPAASCTADINDRSLRLTCDTGIATFTRVGPGSEENAV